MMQRAYMAAMATLCLATAAPAAQPDTQPLQYTRDIRPILSAHCFNCHGPDEGARKAGLRLDLAEAAHAGGKSGTAIVPGDPNASELIKRILTDDPSLIMPPPDAKHPLSAEQKRMLRDWVAQGGTYEPHWAFQPPRRHPAPAVSQPDWVRDPIDLFILQRIESQGLTPSPEADRYTLVRRVYLDLIGLAPTPEEAAAFVNDLAPDAYEKLVDRLLASPHFGERWGKHWLDVARYADSNGWERDYQRPCAWRWRDWVIQSFNRDQPYNEFVIEQIAGDMLPNATIEQRLASAFHRNELHNTEGGIDVGEARWRKAIGQVNAVGSAFMGLTVGCAECHNHKTDPLSQREYHQLLDFFYGQMEHRNVPWEQFNDPNNRGVEVRPGTREGDELTKYLAGDWAHVVMVREKRRDTHIRVRGVYTDVGEKVTAGTPAFLPPLKPRGEQPDRLDLAYWLASEEHPLTARVAVNFIWSKLMGAGIVATLDDFGLTGDLPSHPELLDTLTVDFIESGWSRKQLIRRIVLSSTYRQSSAFREDIHAVDPNNRLLARQWRRRIEAELVRDHALRAAGLLRLDQVGGPSFRARIPREMQNLGWGNTWEVSPGDEQLRRGLYMAYQRNTPVPMLAAFDHPDASIACARREVSNTPLQTLVLWNSPDFLEAARAMGVRLLSEAPGGDVAARSSRLLQLCLTRPATEEEQQVVVDLFVKLHEEYKGNGRAARQVLGQTPLPEGVDAADAAAWIVASRTLLSMDETYLRK
mgnify:FL=1